jgi:hypothetical protein
LETVPSPAPERLETLKTWHHWVLAVIVGYIIGYYFRGVGNMTLGKLMPAGSAMGAGPFG